MKQSLYKSIVSLNSRQGWKKSPFFMCEGLRCCREAFQRRPGWIEAVVYEESFNPEDLDISRPEGEIISSIEFRELANTETPQGVMLILRRPDLTQFPETLGDTVLVLDRLADPGNLGTILRSAWAMGLTSVVWTSGTCHPLGTKAIRAGMGAQFALNLPCIPTLSDLIHRFPDRRIWLTSPRGDISCDSADFITSNSFIVLGNEAGGVETLQGVNLVKIPMPGSAESLNVAQAATIFLYEAVRQSRN